MRSIVKYIKESFWELKYKMTWPTQKELERLTTLFFVGILLWTAYIFGIDQILQKVQEAIYNWIKGK